ncbi:MAG: hypothetical protein IM606_12370 [Cytophagales bacterium]|jgi:hypothetical protein|nr:hypothetical protein [Cytophagales bacterium]MCA6387492.1 hypothetical protein [Cytophagales bacterium]MCA6390657.1 hypothetical protein [Cytophagales bacterium]MCA6395974.1 hypothetical protein [Cytophagales bacterium]MCA6402694.1 hypothetical protein [Cytophagales bacterium]
MKTPSKRNAARIMHIITGSTIATYIYSPLAENGLFQNVIRFIVIPLTIISGLWLWKGHYFKSSVTKNKKTFLLASLCFLFNPFIFAQTNEPVKHKRWGVEVSLVGAAAFSIAQAKVTYLINPEKKMCGTEVGLGFLVQPESTSKANDAFNADGQYSANMLSIGIRQYFWKGLHFEYVANLGNAKITKSKVDGKDYSAFVIFSQSFIGYKFNVLKREKFNLFIIGQGGFGYAKNFNQWPEVKSNASPVYGLGDLKIGISF